MQALSDIFINRSSGFFFQLDSSCDLVTVIFTSRICCYQIAMNELIWISESFHGEETAKWKLQCTEFWFQFQVPFAQFHFFKVSKVRIFCAKSFPFLPLLCLQQYFADIFLLCGWLLLRTSVSNFYEEVDGAQIFSFIGSVVDEGHQIFLNVLEFERLNKSILQTVLASILSRGKPVHNPLNHELTRYLAPNQLFKKSCWLQHSQ